MQFGEFTKTLNKYFEVGRNRQVFMCFLLHSVMGEPITAEEIAQDQKDEFYPFATKKSKSSAYKAYSGKTFPKDEAKKAVSHFRPDELKSYIEELDSIDNLAKDMTRFGVTCDSSNVGDKISDYLYAYLTDVSNDAIPVVVSVSSITNDVSLNKQFEHYAQELLHETGNKCPLCGQLLYIKTRGGTRPCYEIAKIYENEEDEYDNLIALCPTCKAQYVYAEDEEKDELFTIKMDLSSLLRINELISTWDVVEGIEKVIQAIPNIPPESLMELRYDPVKIKDKIDIQTDFGLYQKVVNYASIYYSDIEQIFKDQVVQNHFKYETFCQQVKARYTAFFEEGLDKPIIYDALVTWLMDRTRGDRIFCEIIIAFFVRKCEVF